MPLFFTRLQRHHETLNALYFLVEGRHWRGEHWQQAVFLGLGFDVGQHGPRQHITAILNLRERAVGAVHTSAGAFWRVNRPGQHGLGRHGGLLSRLHRLCGLGRHCLARPGRQWRTELRESRRYGRSSKDH